MSAAGRITARFFDGRTAAAHNVWVDPASDRLVIRHLGDNSILTVWLADQLKRRGTREQDGSLILTAASEPDARLIVSDEAAISLLAELLPHYRLSARRWGAKGWTIALAACIGVIYGIHLCLRYAPGWVAPSIPDAWFADMGNSMLYVLVQDDKICDAAPGQTALNDLVRRLGAQSDGKPVSVAVVENELVNAVALPGGRVVIFKGLIDAAQDGDQVAGVIAHELGHVQHRHVTQNLLRQFGALILFGQVGYAPGGGFAGTAADLSLLSYGREAEAEADQTGIKMLEKAGLRSDGLSRFFATLLKSSEGQLDDVLPDWIKTHPSLSDRREATERSHRGRPAFSDAQWKSLQAICQSSNRLPS